MAEVKDNPIINYVAAAAQSHAADTQAKLDIQKQLDTQEASSADAMLQATTIGNANALISNAEESWKAATDSKIAAKNKTLGTDWNDLGSKTNYWAKEMADNADKAYASLDVIKEKKTKTLLNDPIGFIEAQFSLPADIATHNYYADKHNAAEANLNELTNVSNAATVGIKQDEQRSSAEVAIAKATAANALAAANVDALKRQAAGDSIKGITEINALTSKQLATVLQVHAAQNSDASLALQRQAQADSHANSLLMQQQRQDILETKAATLGDWQYQMEVRNIGAKARGMAPIESVDMFRREYSIQNKNPVYQDMLAYGSSIKGNLDKNGVPSLSGVPVANNAGDAARNYAAGGNNLSANPVGAYLASVYSTKKTDPGAIKDPAAFSTVINNTAVEGATKMLRSIDNSPNAHGTNLYAAPPPLVMLKAAAVYSNPFIVDTVVPMVELNKSVVIPDAVMLAKAAEYAKTNKANFNIAAQGIVDYYSQAVIKNNSQKLFKENGLPPQLDYTANINGININLNDITQVRRYLFQTNMATYTNALTGAR